MPPIRKTSQTSRDEGGRIVGNEEVKEQNLSQLENSTGNLRTAYELPLSMERDSEYSSGIFRQAVERCFMSCFELHIGKWGDSNTCRVWDLQPSSSILI